VRKHTQGDIAKALGISQTTVALVVGNTSSPSRQRLSAETVRRIEEKAKELGYVPHRAAQTLRKGQSNLIVLLNFGGYSEIGSRRSYNIGRLVHEAGFDFQTIDAYWWIGEGQNIVNQILALRPRGLVISGVQQLPLPVQDLIAAGISIVTLGAEIEGIPWVRYDARAAIRTLTEYTIEAGRRRLALMVPNNDGRVNWQTSARLNGFLDGIGKHSRRSVRTYAEGESEFGFTTKARGIEAAIIVARLRPRPFQDFEPAMETTERILSADVQPEALICSNDKYAMGTATICCRRGVSIPGDIRISGFDNLTFTTQGSVPLTTVEQPTERMCEAVVEMLKARLDLPARLEAKPEEQVFPCEIIWRDSAPSPSLLPTKTLTETK